MTVLSERLGKTKDTPVGAGSAESPGCFQTGKDGAGRLEALACVP